MSPPQSDGAACASMPRQPVDLTPPTSSSGDSDAAKLLDSEGSSSDDNSDSMGDGIDVDDPMEDDSSGGCAEDLLSDSLEPDAGAPDDTIMDVEGLLSNDDVSDDDAPLVERQQRQMDSLGPEK